MQGRPKKVLLVDDDEGVLGPFGSYLSQRGNDLEALTAASGTEAIKILTTEDVDLVVSDLHMPDGDGVDLLAYLSSHLPTIPVIVMSGYIRQQDIEALSRYGHLKCLRKPLGPSAVFDAVMESFRTASQTTSLNNFSLAGILQLVEIEEKTCLLKATRDDQRDGSFFFVKGKMQRAICGPLRGEDAALEMLTWEHLSMSVKPLLHMEEAHLGPDHNVTDMIEQAVASMERAEAEAADLKRPDEPPLKVKRPRKGAKEDDAAAPPADAPAFHHARDPDTLRARTREIRLTLIIISMLIVYHLSCNMNGAMRDFFGGALDHPGFVFLNQALFFWVIGLLWIAFRRWFATSRREADFSAILASTGPELLMVIDSHRNVVMCSEAVEKVLGYQLSETIHQKADTLFQHSPDPLMEESVYEALRKFGFHRGEGLGKCKDGRTVQLEIITNRLKGGTGEVVLIRDITARKDHEHRLREAKETAEAAVREREQALADLEQSYAKLQEAESLRDSLTHMVVHDMKSPLTVIEAYVYLLKDQVPQAKEDGEVKDFLEATLAQTRRLSLMVHSLLDTSRLEAGRLALQPQVGSIGDTIEAALKYVSTPDVTRHIRVESTLEADLFSFDPDMLERVLANLVTNAIKYDEDGDDLVIQAEADGPWVTVAVLDRGPGIPEHSRELIFEKFGRIDENGPHRSGSSGLGLTFCRMAVEAHGGRIGVSPREGGGSRFWITLPYQTAPCEEPETAPAPASF